MFALLFLDALVHASMRQDYVGLVSLCVSGLGLYFDILQPHASVHDCQLLWHSLLPGESLRAALYNCYTECAIDENEPL